MTTGILAAFLALLCWGFGDFSIQRAVRGVGSTVALFAITALGAVGLLPFVWRELPTLVEQPSVMATLALAAAVMTIAAYFEFRSFRIGKLSVEEPVLSLELVFTMGIGILLLGEHLSSLQLTLAAVVFFGIILTIVEPERRRWWQRHQHGYHLEPGVLLALSGTAFMTLANIFTGLGSKAIGNGVLAIWFTHLLIAFFCLILLVARGTFRHVLTDVRTHWHAVLAESIFDNAAWVAFAVAVTQLPIALTIAITESYIALAAFLGVVVNRERLQTTQYIGMAVTLIAAVVLGAVSAA